MKGWAFICIKHNAFVRLCKLFPSCFIFYNFILIYTNLCSIATHVRYCIVTLGNQVVKFVLQCSVQLRVSQPILISFASAPFQKNKQPHTVVHDCYVVHSISSTNWKLSNSSAWKCLPNKIQDTHIQDKLQHEPFRDCPWICLASWFLIHKLRLRP